MTVHIHSTHTMNWWSLNSCSYLTTRQLWHVNAVSHSTHTSPWEGGWAVNTWYMPTAAPPPLWLMVVGWGSEWWPRWGWPGWGRSWNNNTIGINKLLWVMTSNAMGTTVISVHLLQYQYKWKTRSSWVEIGTHSRTIKHTLVYFTSHYLQHVRV